MDNYVGVKKGPANDKVFDLETKNTVRHTVGHEKTTEEITAMVAKMNGLSNKGTDKASLEKGVNE